MFKRCQSCGVESRLTTAFRKSAGLASVKILCPRCRDKQQTSLHQFHLGAHILLALFGLILLMLPDSLGVLWVAGAFCLLPVFVTLALVPHELGHALAAQLLGLRVFSISFGLLGRTIWKRRLFDCTVEMKSLPFIGYTVVGHRSQRWLRLRHFLMVLAAPTVNATLFAPVSVLLDSTDVGAGTLLMHAFCWANLLMLPLNLWPRQIGGLPSDGLQLLRTPFLGRAEIQDFLVDYFVREGMACHERGDWPTARAWLERGLKEYPHNVYLLDGLAIVSLRQQRFAEARELLGELLEHSDLVPVLRAVFLSHAAWADLLSGETALLDEADRYSREAMEWLPWLADVRGARGSVLVQRARAEEGIPLLCDALTDHTDPKDKAIDACYLALGYAQCGSSHQAWMRLEEARKFDSSCYLLPRVLQELRRTVIEEKRSDS
jgi:hypothetical protein